MARGRRKREEIEETMQPMTHPELADNSQYEALAVAIIAKACEDYMNAYRSRWFKDVRPGSPYALQLENEILDDELWFNSDQFIILSEGKIEAGALIDRLQWLAENTDQKTLGAKFC